MQPITHDLLMSNAYRTLGLAATASQAEVNRAARKMLIWPDGAAIPPTPWDLPGLGKLTRSKNDLQQAFSNLNEPQSRVQERLLWFHTPGVTSAALSVPSLDAMCRQWANSHDPAARHDAALAALHAALLLDPSVQDESRWQRAIGGLGMLAGSDDYREFLHRVETAGDFEKRAQGDEIDLALHLLPESTAALLLPRAETAIDQSDFAGLGRIVRILAGAGSVQLQYRLLDRVEDVLERRCRQLHDALAGKLITDRDNIDVHIVANRGTCYEAARSFNATVAPLLTQLEALGAGDPDRGFRARRTGANALSEVALAWVWSADFITAEGTYAAALDLAMGTALEPRIRSDMEDNARLAERQRLGLRRDPAARPPRTLGFEWTTNKPKKGSTSKGTSKGSWWWIAVVIMIVRAIISFSNSGSSSRSVPSVPSYRNPSVPSYTPGNNPGYDPSNPDGTFGAPGSGVPRSRGFGPRLVPFDPANPNRNSGAPGGGNGTPSQNSPGGASPGRP